MLAVLLAVLSEVLIACHAVSLSFSHSCGICRGFVRSWMECPWKTDLKKENMRMKSSCNLVM